MGIDWGRSPSFSPAQYSPQNSPSTYSGILLLTSRYPSTGVSPYLAVLRFGRVFLNL